MNSNDQLKHMLARNEEAQRVAEYQMQLQEDARRHAREHGYTLAQRSTAQDAVVNIPVVASDKPAVAEQADTDPSSSSSRYMSASQKRIREIQERQKTNVSADDSCHNPSYLSSQPPSTASSSSLTGLSSLSRASALASIHAAHSQQTSITFRKVANKGRLGSGANGTVYCAETDEGVLIAVKELKVRPSDQTLLQETVKEINAMSAVRHPNVVGLLGTSICGDVLSVLMEYCPGNSLRHIIQEQPLNEEEARPLIRQVCYGLAHCHAKGLVHRDIKGANILLNEGCVKLADFGSALSVHEIVHANDLMGGMTPQWAAPEVLRHGVTSDRSDVWSIGCTVLELLTGKDPWEDSGHTGMSVIITIVSTPKGPTIPDTLSPVCKDFVNQCLQQDPALRPSAAMLLTHPWITGDPMDMNTEATNESHVVEGWEEGFYYRMDKDNPVKVPYASKTSAFRHIDECADKYTNNRFGITQTQPTLLTFTEEGGGETMYSGQLIGRSVMSKTYSQPLSDSSLPEKTKPMRDGEDTSPFLALAAQQ